MIAQLLDEHRRIVARATVVDDKFEAKLLPSDTARYRSVRLIDAKGNVLGELPVTYVEGDHHG